MTLSIGIKGIQEAQRENARLMAAMKPGGKFERAVWRVTVSLHRYAVSITHVDTGSLRASQRMTFDPHSVTGHISIDRSTVNPKSGQRPYRYGFYEEARGGHHAFYRRTVDEAAARTVEAATRGMFK